LSLEPERAIGGLVRPGDKVTVLAAQGVVADQVLVYHVLRELTVRGDPDGVLVTLAVDEVTAQKILSFADNNTVWLGASR
jgi:hypothetical protein